MRLLTVLSPFLALALACSSATPSRSSDKKDKKEKKSKDEDEEEGEEEENSGGKAGADVDYCNDGGCDEEEEDDEEEEPEPVPPAEFSIIGPLANASAQPRIKWEKAEGATKYHVVIAKDDECKDVVKEQEDVTETEVQLKEVDVGDAYLCVTAENADGKTKAKNNAQGVKINKGWVKVSTTGGTNKTRIVNVLWNGSEVVTYGGIGSGATNDADAKIHAYDPAKDTWREVTATGTAPKNRYGLSAALVDGKMLVYGGLVSNGGGTIDSMTFDFTKGEWSPLAGDGIPPAVAGGSIVGGDGKAFVMESTKGYTYTPATDKWEPLKADSPVAHGYGCSVWNGKELFHVGGQNSGKIKGHAYDLAAGTWRAMSDSALSSSMAYPGCATDHDRIYVYTGRDAMEIYDIAGNSWTTVDMTNGPANRYYPSIAWVGEGLFVLGGAVAGSTTTEAWIYYP